MGLFFRVQKPREYNYKPLYYDERKENMRKRIEQAEKELNHTEDPKPYQFDFKGAFTNKATYFQKQKAKNGDGVGRFVRLFLILAILLLVIWILSLIEFPQ